MKELRTKKVNTIKEGTLIVAIDIGMVSNHGCCTTADGRSTKTFKFDNTREGLDILWTMVLASKTRFQCNEVIIGYESTGPYGEPLIHYLRQKQATIVQVNPLHTKRMREINDNSPLKTDRKDPRVIADVIRIGHALSVVVPEGDAAYLRRLNNARERHIRERTALLNQLQQFVFLIFPEFTYTNNKNDMQQDSLTYTQEIYDTGKGMQRKYRETRRGNEETEQGQVRGRTCCGADQLCKDLHRYSRGVGRFSYGYTARPRPTGDGR